MDTLPFEPEVPLLTSFETISIEERVGKCCFFLGGSMSFNVPAYFTVIDLTLTLFKLNMLKSHPTPTET